HYMDSKAFSHASSIDLRDALTVGSGINMNRFFDDWVFTPGFPHFSVDSIVYMPGGLDHYFIYTRQRSKGNANHLYEMPVEINFTDGVNDTTVRVVIDSLTNMFHIPIYFSASMITLDRYGKISDARVGNEKTVTNTGTQPVAETSFSMNVSNVGIPNARVRIEHHLVPPDPFMNSNPGIRLSDNRFWRVDGFFTNGFAAKGIFVFDGSVSASTGYLDNTFITGTEDSLTILYRPGPGYEWQLVNGFTVNIASNANDRRGSIAVDTLKKGEYAMGYYDYLVSTENIPAAASNMIQVAPNPSKDTFEIIRSKSLNNKATAVIYDNGGRKVYDCIMGVGEDRFTWDASEFPAGIYHLVLQHDGIKGLQSAKLIKSTD
ncbi:MAG: T9SS type A sorting domain-containing protein, partial [Bacteroidota bacterium]